MRINAIVQARMGSTRLPGKVMKVIEGKPLIGHIFDRLKKVRGIEKIFLATTVDPRNDSLVEYAMQERVEAYRHKEENDIIGRLYNILSLDNADAFLKINGDCPLIDPNIIIKGIVKYKKKINADILTNKISDTLPLGFSFEIISAKAVTWCNTHLKSREDRELAIMWIINNKKQFPKQFSISYEKNYGSYNLCVDTEEDFKLICLIFKKLYKKNKYFGIEDVISFIKKDL